MNITFQDDGAVLEGEVKIFVPKNLLSRLYRPNVGANWFDSFKKTFSPIQKMSKNPLVKMAAGFVPGGTAAMNAIDMAGNGVGLANALLAKKPKKIVQLVKDAGRGNPSAFQTLNKIKQDAASNPLAAKALKSVQETASILTDRDDLVDFLGDTLIEP